MKQYSLNTHREPVVIEIGLMTNKPRIIHFRIDDINKVFTTYIDTYVGINGKADYKFNLPISPEIARISIWSDNNGSDFDIQYIRKDVLLSKLSEDKFNNPSIKSFINFATFFCDNAGILSGSSGGKEFSMYSSDDGLFKVKYSDVIRGDKKGNNTPQSTPARVHSGTKIIELSRPKYIIATVPARFGIMGHEFAHVFENIDPSNESEADENAVLMMLLMGFPKIEILEAWTRVFEKAPSKENKMRYDKIKQLIINYKR